MAMTLPPTHAPTPNLSGDDSFRMKAIRRVLYEDWRLTSRMVTTADRPRRRANAAIVSPCTRSVKRTAPQVMASS